MKLFKLITLAVAVVLVATFFSCNGAGASKDLQTDSTAVIDQNAAKVEEVKPEETVAQADTIAKDSVVVVAEEKGTGDKAAE